MSVIIFIAVLFILILVHECGHFLIARKFGIWIEEFAIGFPPRIFAKKIGETLFSVNIIPLGGFVKIFGENPEDPEFVNSDKRDRGFVSKPKYAQALVLLGGIFFNLIFAWLLLSFAFSVGVPASVSNGDSSVSNAKLTVTGILPNSPAEKAGIKSGDVITHIETSSKEKPDTLSTPTTDNLRAFISSHPNDTLEIGITRGGEEKKLSVKPEIGVAGDAPAIGIAMDTIGKLRLPIHKAILKGAKSTAQITWGTMKAFVNLIGDSFKGKADVSSLTGPIGIAGAVGDASQFGFSYLISFAALISVNLAVLNLIPFPALDGGRLFFLLIETIIRRPLNQKVISYIHLAGFCLLIGLMIFITYKDIVKMF